MEEDVVPWAAAKKQKVQSKPTVLTIIQEDESYFDTVQESEPTPTNFKLNLETISSNKNEPKLVSALYQKNKHITKFFRVDPRERFGKFCKDSAFKSKTEHETKYGRRKSGLRHSVIDFSPVRKNPFIINPQSKRLFVFKCIFTVFNIFSIFSTVFVTCFDPEILVSLLLADYFCDLLGLIAMVLNFRTSFDLDGTGKMNEDWRAIARRYVRSGFLMDLLIVFPFEIFVWSLFGSHIYFGRLNKLLRIRQIRAFFKLLLQDVRANFIVARLLYLFVQFALYGVLWAGVWHLLSKGSDDLTGSSDLATAYGAFLEAALFSFSLITVGYNSILPVSTWQHILCCVCSLFNLTFAAYVCGDVSSLLSNQSSSSDYRSLASRLDKYVTFHKLPASLSTNLHNFLHASFKENIVNDKMIEVFPSSLRLSVAKQLYSHVLMREPVFNRCPTALLDQICMMLKPDMAPEGSLIASQGNIVQNLIFVNSGSLMVERFVDGKMVTFPNTKALIGTVAFIFRTRYPSSVRAATPCKLLVLARSDYERCLKQFPAQERVVFAHAVESDKEVVQDNFDSLASAWNKIEQEQLNSLCYSAWEGNMSTVEHLREVGMDLNLHDYDGRTALHVAAVEGRSKIVEYLLQHGANPNCLDRWGNSPLKEAFVQRHDDCVALLRNAGGQLRLQNVAEYLCNTASLGEVDKLKRLLSFQEINVNLGDYDGRTAMHLCAAEGKIKVIDVLIAANAQVNVVDRWGNTPLGDAVRSRQTLVAQKLVKHGAVLGHFDLAPKLCELAQANDFDGIQLLALLNVNLNAADYDGRTALHLAASEGNLRIVEHLLNLRTPPSPIDRWGREPLEDAIKMHHSEVADCLRRYGASLHSSKLVEPMCTAAATGDVVELKFLVSHGAQANVGDYDDRTPLHLACSEGHLQCAKFLIAEGANINCQDRMGGTPLADAIRCKHKAVISWLKSKNAKIFKMPRKSVVPTQRLAASSGGQTFTVPVVDDASPLPSLADDASPLPDDPATPAPLPAEAELPLGSPERSPAHASNPSLETPAGHGHGDSGSPQRPSPVRSPSLAVMLSPHIMASPHSAAASPTDFSGRSPSGLAPSPHRPARGSLRRLDSSTTASAAAAAAAVSADLSTAEQRSLLARRKKMSETESSLSAAAGPGIIQKQLVGSDTAALLDPATAALAAALPVRGSPSSPQDPFLEPEDPFDTTGLYDDLHTPVSRTAGLRAAARVRKQQPPVSADPYSRPRVTLVRNVRAPGVTQVQVALCSMTEEDSLSTVAAAKLGVPVTHFFNSFGKPIVVVTTEDLVFCSSGEPFNPANKYFGRRSRSACVNPDHD